MNHGIVRMLTLSQGYAALASAFKNTVVFKVFSN